MTNRWCLLAVVLFAATAGAGDLRDGHFGDLGRFVEANGRNALVTSRCALALRRGCRDTGMSRVRAAARSGSCLLGNNSNAGLTFNTEGPQPANQHASLPSSAIISQGDLRHAQLVWEGSKNSAPIGPVKGSWSGRGRRPRSLSHGVSQVSQRSAKPSSGTVSVNEIVAEISSCPSYRWAVQHSKLAQKASPQSVLAFLRGQLSEVTGKGDGRSRELMIVLWVARYFPSEKYASTLEEIIKDKSLSLGVREAAVVALGTCFPASRMLDKLLASEDDKLRAAAIHAIALGLDDTSLGIFYRQQKKRGFISGSDCCTNSANMLADLSSALDVSDYLKDLDSSEARVRFIISGSLYGLSFHYEYPLIAAEFRMEHAFRELLELFETHPEVVTEILRTMARNKKYSRSAILLSDLGVPLTAAEKNILPQIGRDRPPLFFTLPEKGSSPRSFSEPPAQEK